MFNLNFDNIIFSLQKAGGISMVWYHLLQNVSKRDDLHVSYLEYRDACTNKFRNKLKICDSDIIFKDPKLLSIKRYLPPKIDFHDNSIFHSSYYRVINNPLVKNVTTVHDFTYEYFYRGLRAKIHTWQKFSAIRNSEIIVCISENTKKDLLKFIPESRNQQIEVIYNGVSDEYFPISNVSNEFSDCLMFIGSRVHYKNFHFAIEAAKETNSRLLICGNALNDDEKKLLTRILPKDKYIEVVHPSNEKVNSLYNSVRALIYPSSYEGFGLPVIEAQKAGCPVIALNASSIPEIIGSEYPIMKELSIRAFKDTLSRFNKDSNKTDLIIYGFSNAKRFGWDKMANRYIQLYKNISNNT